MGDAGSPVKSYKITGIGKAGRGPNGEIPKRREVDNWWFDKSVNATNQRSLFIYALINLQARGLDDPEKPDPLSYFSIAGIHGIPLQPWPVGNKEKSDWYCAHGKTLFSTWHTPYMLLYEQRLWEEMRDLIPGKFAEEDHEAMYHAADTWRLPYWDWARKKPSWNADDPDHTVNDPTKVKAGDGPNAPFVITQEKVEVKTATGTTKVQNPMYNFAVPAGRTFGHYKLDYTAEQKAKDRQLYDRPWIPTCSVTCRHPDFEFEELDAEKWHALSEKVKEDYNQGKRQDWKKVQQHLRGNIEVKSADEKAADGKADDEKVADRKAANRKVAPDYQANALPERVRRLFNSSNGKSLLNYQQFSTSSVDPAQPVMAYSSIEAIHNDIHWLAGGNGFMGNTGTAAFDPLFWLHHCNVDRLVASWQIMFAHQYEEWLRKDTTAGDNPDTELAPFAKDENFTYFTSRDSAKMFDLFGYEYETLKGGDAQSAETLARDFGHLYATTALASLELPENKTAKEIYADESDAERLAASFASPLLVDKADKQAPSESAKAILRHLTWGNNDYVANVIYERFALNGKPFSVGIFLGESPGLSLFDIGRDETAVGTVYNFSSVAEDRGATMEGCESCRIQQREGAKFSGQVILTDVLIAKILQGTEENGLVLKRLDEESVVPYLQANLHFQVFDEFKRPIDSETMRGLVSVSVAVSRATHFGEPGRNSDYTPYRYLWEVTEGKKFGASSSDPSYVASQ